MRSTFPILSTQGERAYTASDSATRSSLTPSVNTWDIATVPLSFPIHVPAGERWCVHFDVESYIQGPNAPTYQTAFGVVLRRATRFEPTLWGGPGSYWHPILAAGDAAWGACSIPLWLNPGITVCNFGIVRDAGAITLMRRTIKATPFLGMKI